MKIDIVPRTYFEERMGTAEVEALLRSHKVISIQSSNGWDSEPPFAKKHCESKNLLCLVFDDYFGIPEDPVERSRVALFTPEHADRIMRFVDDGSMPLVVLCTQGARAPGDQSPPSEILRPSGCHVHHVQHYCQHWTWYQQVWSSRATIIDRFKCIQHGKLDSQA